MVEFYVLRDRLLAIGGTRVVETFEEDLDKLLERGEVFDGATAVMHRMGASACHRNVAELTEDDPDLSVVTGWALSSDGIWRQHSWGLTTTQGIIETTERRRTYFGFVLTDAESDVFRFENY